MPMDFDALIVDGKLKMRYWNDPVLSTVCDPVAPEEFGSELEQFGQLMLKTIEHKGIGLAAPQVGLTKRVFVLKRQDETLPPIIAVNPEVVTYGEDVAHQEGCLSVPSIYEQVTRPRFATLKYQHPLTGETHSVELADYDAYCAQHENDHLDGIMFFDRRRVSRQVNKSVERAWEKIKAKVVS